MSKQFPYLTALRTLAGGRRDGRHDAGWIAAHVPPATAVSSQQQSLYDRWLA